jgi:DNA-binding transcriptional regulator YiaG
MAKNYRLKALAAVHEVASGLRDAGVMDNRTMKAFDELCLTRNEPLAAAQIRRDQEWAAVRRVKK